MTPRKNLADVLGGARADLARQFEEAEVAGDLAPLPRGTYRCRLTGGELTTAKSGTPGFALTFSVDDGEHKGRKLWHNVWLTPAALPLAKRDLGKIGITSLAMLDRPLPAGFVCVVKAVVRADDDGVERNRVATFDVVEVLDDPTADSDFPSPLPN